MEPKISIIVPVYNAGKYLKKCLDSIINQTFTNIEVIVVNDGSTDESRLICDRYAKKDHRIKVIHKKHAGVSDSRNIGINHAQGDYIGFVDGDDYIQQDMYKRLYELCIDTKSDISICRLGREIDGKIINHNKIQKGDMKLFDNQTAISELFKGVLYRFSLCNKLFHKRCFDDIHFPEGRIHEDLATTYRLFSQAKQSVFINQLLYIYVKQENSILTTKYHEKRMDSLIAWEEIIPFMNENYDELLDDVYACFGYWCVDHVYYILNQVDDKWERKKYLKIVQAIINTSYQPLINNQILSFKYKYIITILRLNIHLLLFSNHLKKVFMKAN